MIVREIKNDTTRVLQSFDWFNDYKDTRSWATVAYPEIIPALDAGHEKWLQEYLTHFATNADRGMTLASQGPGIRAVRDCWRCLSSVDATVEQQSCPHCGALNPLGEMPPQ